MQPELQPALVIIMPPRPRSSRFCLVGKELLLPASGAIKASLIAPFGR
jgi:hypothetical protein